MARRSNGNGNGTRARTRRRALHIARPQNGRKTIVPQGTLIIIGGHEEKKGKAIILRAVAERAKGGKVVVATLATSEPEETFKEYRHAFTSLGVKQAVHLDVTNREDL